MQAPTLAPSGRRRRPRTDEAVVGERQLPEPGQVADDAGGEGAIK